MRQRDLTHRYIPAGSILRPAGALAAIAVETFLFQRWIPVNITTVGFLYLITILAIATEWGLVEAVLASVAATVCYNFFFFPPVGTLTIADPLNWVALLTFLITSLTASQLSERAKRRTREAASRQLEMESLYSLSRAILLAETDQPLARHIAREISRIYELPSVIIYDRDTGQMHRGGPGEIPGIQKQILDSAAHGTHFRDDQTQTIVSTISFGGQPSGSVALKGASLSDVALQGLLNLIALGLEKARGQEAATRAEAARQSEEFKSTLLDALAHEFKTPLTSIRAATTGILASGSTKPEELRELLAIMDQEANRLSALVNEAIHLARIEAGKVQLNKQACPARTIVDAALTQMDSALEGRHIELSVANDLPPVLVDRELTQIVFRHLIDNAVKYSAAMSPISIAARPSGGALVFSIRNEGEGINEWEQPKIFEKFYRGSTVRHRIPGTGMGLAITREIVLAHGGDIRVDSSPGEGAEFIVSLPLAGKEIPA